MESRHPWFRRLDAEHRSWITLVAQAGIDGFVKWFADPEPSSPEHRRRLRLGAAGAGPQDLAVPDRRAGPDHDRRGREPDRRGDAQGRPAVPARRDRRSTAARSPSPPPRSTPGPPSCAGPGTPGSRRWSSTPCCAARPTRPCCPAPPPSAGARPPRSSSWSVRRRHWSRRRPWSRSGTPRPSPASTCSARCRATGWSSCSAGPALSEPTRPLEVVGKFVDLLRRRARSSSGPPVEHLMDAAASTREALSGLPGGRRLAGGSAAGRVATTCCPSGRSPATATPAARWPATSTTRCSPPAAVCWRRWSPSSTRACRSRPPPARCSCTPTPSATGSAASTR